MTHDYKRTGRPRICSHEYVRPNSHQSVFHSVDELTAAIQEYIGKYNTRLKPFIWTAKASDIREKAKRARSALDNR